MQPFADRGKRGLFPIIVIDADESVRGLLARVDELMLENSGSFRRQGGEALPLIEPRLS